VIHITKGYSKDHAPELNQVVVQMILSSQIQYPDLDRSTERQHLR
jgi:transposase